ncbi:MAG TPA: cytochrome c biogenesis protein CcdA [Blastocatellia bacterium]|nr:cytochrome c biogenesis protein CcdA [Blastocatellia bacterium]
MPQRRKVVPAAGLAALLVLFLPLAAFAQGSDRVVKAKGYASVDAVRPGDRFKVAVALEVGEGYHINAHRPTLDFLIATDVNFEPTAGLTIGDAKYPAPKHRKFEFAPDTELAVHEGTVYLTAEVQADKTIPPGAATIKALVTVQSCNDAQCLAPADLPVEIPIRVVAATQAVKSANSEVFAKAASAPPDNETPGAAVSGALTQFQGSAAPPNKIAELITSKGLALTLLFVFVSGLLLNTTPCVYPIIPITIGFFVNQSASRVGKPSLGRTFSMASMYVIGMAITYSVLGVVASLSKGLFGAALQNPIVLIALAAVMVALALSMFGVYEFKLPESLNRFANSSTQSTSGIVGALVMGLTMGIVAAPCIGPFVLALLVFVGEKGDPVYGFFMFFVLALGLGLPYLVLGTFSGAIKALPRSGLWMVTVRKVFGLVLVGMALYFLMPLMGDRATLVFVVFFALSALYLILWEAGKTKPKQFAWILRAVGAGAAVVAVMMALPKKIEAEIAWLPYSEQAIAQAQREGKGIIIDTFADWCIPCKELDKLTFTDSTVKSEAERFVTLKLDLTSNDPNSEAGRARQRFGIRGVPTVIFLDNSGRELADLRLEGFEKPSAFLARMKRVQSSPAGAAALAKNAADTKAPIADAAAGEAPEPAPSVSLNLLGGGSLALDSLRGKVALVDFWATWCVPCLSEIPMFNQLQKEYQPRGLEVIAISLDEEGAAKVKPFLKAHPMDYTQVIGDQSTAAAFNVSADTLPVTLVIDKQGRIRFRHVGVTKKDVLETEINQLLGE